MYEDMTRSEQIAQYIADNMRDPDVIEKADAEFGFSEQEAKTANIAGDALVAIRFQLEIMDMWKELADEMREVIDHVRQSKSN